MPKIHKIHLDAETIAFLTHLWRGGESSYWWYLDEQTYITKHGVEENRHDTIWFSSSQIPQFLMVSETQHAYFGVHPDGRRKKSERLTKYHRSTINTINATNCLFAEFDGDVSRADIEGIVPTPSVIIESSPSKFHCYWLFRETSVISNHEQRSDAIDLQRDWVEWLGADPSSSDLARVLRIPGSHNIKYPDRPVVAMIRCDLDILYDRKTLADACMIATKARTAKPKNKEHGSVFTTDISVIRSYNERYSIEDTLASYGYEPRGKRWVRPGGKSASVVVDGGGRSFHFSSNDPAYDPDHTHDAFGLFTILTHSGDTRAAVKHAAEEMGMTLPQNNAPHRRTAAAPHPPHQTPYTNGVSNEPVPPSPHTKRLAHRMAENEALLSSPSVFPVDVMPPAIRDMVITTAISSETDTAMAGMAALGIMSAMVNRATTVVYDNAWEESTVLSVMIFAPSGERKSAVMNPLLRPLLNRQRRMYEAYDEELKAWKKRQRTAPQKQDEDESDEEPKRQLMYLSDVTPARLVRVMSDNGARAAAVSDEARSFMSTVMGNRHNRDGGDDLALFCSGWDGRDYIFERVGQGSIVLKDPRLTLCLMMQNDVLDKMSQNQALRDSGFLARCLVSMPPSRIGYRTHDAPPPRPDIVQAYEEACEKVMGLGEIQARLEYDALERIRVFNREKEIHQRSGGRYEGVPDWLQKASSHIIRVATLFAIFDGFRDCATLPITVGHVERAIHIIEYCLHQWQRVDGSMTGENRMQQDAMAVLRWMNRTGRQVGDTMPIREIVAAVRCIKNTRYAEDVCAYLVESGRLQQMDRQPGQRSLYYRILSLDMEMKPPEDTHPTPTDEETPSLSSRYDEVIAVETEMRERVITAYQGGTLYLADYGDETSDRYAVEDEHGIILMAPDEQRLRGWCSHMGIIFNPPDEPAIDEHCRTVEGYD